MRKRDRKTSERPNWGELQNIFLALCYSIAAAGHSRSDQHTHRKHGAVCLQLSEFFQKRSHTLLEMVGTKWGGGRDEWRRQERMEVFKER